MEDGRLAEVAMFGREGLFGLLSAFISREAFGRYVVQIVIRLRIGTQSFRRCNVLSESWFSLKGRDRERRRL